jgi:RNA polymerase sigma factor (sigma-70 family)
MGSKEDLAHHWEPTIPRVVTDKVVINRKPTRVVTDKVVIDQKPTKRRLQVAQQEEGLESLSRGGVPTKGNRGDNLHTLSADAATKRVHGKLASNIFTNTHRRHDDHIFHSAAPEDLTPEQWAEIVGVPQDAHSNLTRARFDDMANARSFNHLISSYMGLVVNIAKQFEWASCPFQDLVQEGAVGLVRAAEKYDPEKGCQFSTYASWWIKGSMQKAIADTSRTIRLPRRVHDMVNRVKSAEREFRVHHGRDPTDEELAARVELTPEKVRFFLEKSKPIMSMEPHTMFLSDPAPGPDQHAELSSTADLVSSILYSVTARDQDILRMRFGLNGAVPKSRQEVADAFCMTRGRVRGIEARALEKLRTAHFELQESW